MADNLKAKANLILSNIARAFLVRVDKYQTHLIIPYTLCPAIFVTKLLLP